MEGRDVGGGNPPQSDPLTGGQFLLQLLRRPPQSHQQMTTTSAQIDVPQRFLYKDPAMGQVNPHLLPSTFNFSDAGRPQFHPPPPWTLPHRAPPPPHQDTAGISLPQFSPPPPGFAPHSQFVPVVHQRGILPRGSSEAFLPGGNQKLGFRNEELDVGGRGRNLGDLERQRNPIEHGQLGARGSKGRFGCGSHVPDHTMSSVGFGQFTYNETDRSHLNDRGKMILPSLRDQGNKQLGFRNEELDVGGRGENLSNGRQQRDSIDYGQLGAGVSQGRDVADGSVSNHTMSSGGVGFGQFAHNETDRSHLNDRGKMVLPSLKGQSQHNAQGMSKRRPHELQNRLKQSSGHDGWSNSPTRRQNANHGDGMVNELKYALPQFGCIVPPVNLQRQLNLDHKVNHAGDIPGNYQNLCSQSQDGKHEVKKEDREGPEGIAREKQHSNKNCLEKEKLGSDALVGQLEDSLEIVEEQDEKSELKVNGSKIKDFRSDFSRGHYVSSQRVRIRRGSIECRYDIRRLSSSFLSIYNSLVPSEEEIARQKELLMSLKILVKKEWPNADLHLYGSCANSFGVSNSDIDICLAIDDSETAKANILLRLADILQLNNFQNVQALTRARVPIVKLMDPVFSISCDICVNNLLAVVNTKLLRDYARIDERLRQLAFLVKHWAKSREVNEAYQGTLSSYAYVLMCIHFLQQCRPPILPCLQEMRATYVVTVEGKNCAFFDEVEELQNFGSSNKQGVAELLWGFFNYWAFQHDYANNVISVRTGSIIRKHVKNWTKRIGNDRHLICIEDPFEISHDLGRVVDKYSIRILREEFERAANILQDYRDPCKELFEPYVRGLTEN